MPGDRNPLMDQLAEEVHDREQDLRRAECKDIDPGKVNRARARLSRSSEMGEAP